MGRTSPAPWSKPPCRLPESRSKIVVDRNRAEKGDRRRPERDGQALGRSGGFFAKRKVKVELARTPEAIEHWNKAKGKVVALFHVTV